MCNQCHQEKCCCQPCTDCTDPDFVVVNPACPPSPCEDLIDRIIDIIGNQHPICSLKFGTPIVSMNSVTLIAQSPNGTVEYSKDGISWQDSPTFILTECGRKRYYIREKSNPLCMASGYATVNTGCGCVPNWQNTANPPVTQCVNGFISNYQADGCGNYRWNPTTTSCSGCVPNWVDVSPQVTQCVAGHIQIKTTDGCGNFGWRDTATACGCTLPSSGNGYQNTQATCLNNVLQNNATITISGIINADKYAYVRADVGTMPTYGNATAVPVNGIVVLTGLVGRDIDTNYVFRLFNGSDSCVVDKSVATIGTTGCGGTCLTPIFTLGSTPPTCNGTSGLTNDDGRLVLSGITNGTHYQYCIDTTFTCTPNFEGAIPITGSGPITIGLPIGFFADQQFRSFAVRVYNGNETCFSDRLHTFNNPCYGQSGCTLPTWNFNSGVKATCAGIVANNNAQVNVSGIVNANRYGISQGTVYSGPAYAGATPIVSGTIAINNLPGVETDTPYVVRLFNGNDTCFTSMTIVVPAAACAPQACCTMQIDSVTLTEV